MGSARRFFLCAAMPIRQAVIMLRARWRMSPSGLDFVYAGSVVMRTVWMAGKDSCWLKSMGDQTA